MPVIVRWFRVSHDINEDPEVWELTRLCGDRALRVWLELLSIADRNGGALPPMSEAFAGCLAGKCQVSRTTVTKVWDHAHVCLWLASDPVPRVRNHLKFHKTRELKVSPTRLDMTRHDFTRLKKDNTSPLARSWPDPFLLVEKYNREVCDDLPAVEKVTPARIKKAKDYLKLFPDEQFWTEVFKQVNASIFLRGKSNGNGHTSFRGDFDWLLTKGKDGTENVAKVWEGKYG